MVGRLCVCFSLLQILSQSRYGYWFFTSENCGELFPCPELCDAVPTYQDACNNTLRSCVGRNNIQLRCYVGRKSSLRVLWYNVQVLNEDETVPLVDPAATVQAGEVFTASSVGYWWCGRVKTQAECLSSIPAVHLYRCDCNNDVICRRTRTCSRDRFCSSARGVLCMSTTTIIPYQMSTTESVNGGPLPTKIPAADSFLENPPATKTVNIPGHQTRDGHSVTTTTIPLHPSVTLTAGHGKDTEIRASSGGSGAIQLLIYTVGPVVALVSIAIVLVLLTCVGCVRYRKNKLRGE